MRIKTDKIILKFAKFTLLLKFIPPIDETATIELVNNNLRKDIVRYFRDFIIENYTGSYDFILEFVLKYPYLAHRKNKSFLYLFEEYPNKIIANQQISLSQAIIIIRYIMQKHLSRHKGLFVHGSASNFRGKAYVFMGDSGAGKSTVVNLLKNKYKMLADDSLIIIKNRGNLHLFQSPFSEKGLLHKNPQSNYIIGKIFFLKKSNRFKLYRLKNKKEILVLLTHQAGIEETFKKRLLQNVYTFINSFAHFYILEFKKDQKELTRFLECVN